MKTVINFDDICYGLSKDIYYGPNAEICNGPATIIDYWLLHRIKYNFIPEFSLEDRSPIWLTGANGSKDLSPIINYLKNEICK